MIDHLGMTVRDLAASRAFYEAALAPIGYSVLMAFPGAVGLGKNGKPDFWIGDLQASYWTADHQAGRAPIHIAFHTDSREVVDAFYAAAMAAGGRDFGGPGPRPQYHAGYYGAFVLDPDGNNVEVVCHGF